MKLKIINFSVMPIVFIFLFALISCAGAIPAQIDAKETSAMGQGSQETETINTLETKTTATEEAPATSAEEVETTANTDNETETTPKVKITPFRFAVSSDSNPLDKNLPQSEVFKDIIEQIGTYEPDLYISAGDIIYGNTGNKEVMLRQINDFLDIMKILDCSFFVSPGDNDLGNDKQKAYFKELINKNKNYYQHFEHKGVNFIILASLGFDQDFIDKQMLWLEEKLKELRNETVFIFIHKPVYSFRNPEEERDEKLINLINEYKVDGVFSGHEHLYNSRTVGKVEYIIAGSSGSRPYVRPEDGGIIGYLIVDVKEESWTYRYFDINGELIDEDMASFN